MAVETVSVSIQVPKELKEVVDALASVVEHLKAGKSVTELAALLPAVLVAVDGVGKVGEEVGSVYNDEGAAYLVHRVFSALKGPEAIPL